MRYEIDEEYAVRIWSDNEEHPFMFQPHYPNLDPFDSEEEAAKWAEAFIKQATDDTRTIPYAPNGKQEPPIYPLSKEAEARLKIQSLGIDLDILRMMLDES